MLSNRPSALLIIKTWFFPCRVKVNSRGCLHMWAFCWQPDGDIKGKWESSVYFSGLVTSSAQQNPQVHWCMFCHSMYYLASSIFPSATCAWLSTISCCWVLIPLFHKLRKCNTCSHYIRKLQQESVQAYNKVGSQVVCIFRNHMVNHSPKNRHI